MSTFEAVFVMFRETNVAKSNLLNTNGFDELFFRREKRQNFPG